MRHERSVRRRECRTATFEDEAAAERRPCSRNSRSSGNGKPAAKRASTSGSTRAGSAARTAASETEQDETLAASPGEALRDAGQKLLSLLVSRASEVAMDRVYGLADKLSGMGEGGGAEPA